MLGGMDAADRRTWIETLRDRVAALERLVDEGRRTAPAEPARRARRGTVLAGIEAELEGVRQLLVLAQLLGVTERHGPGPYPFDALVAMTGADPDRLQAVLDQMVADGVMQPPPGNNDH
uniref:hypothetical protein n=1 Tax=Promicromonospora sp. CA-289581 TaxID=3240013 RepID=UPI003F498711